MLRTNWTAKMANANLTTLLLIPFLTTRYKAIPIKIKRIVQTGPNIQFGGLNDGLFNKTYHDAISGIVNKEPINPAERDNRIQIANFKNSIITTPFIISQCFFVF